MLVLSGEGKMLSFSEGYGIYSTMGELALRRRMDDCTSVSAGKERTRVPMPAGAHANVEPDS